MTNSDSSPIQPAGTVDTEPTIQCSFVAQAWGGHKFNTAIEVEPRGEVTWSVPRSWLQGRPIPKENTYESDDLRDYPGAPQWIRDWDGPFEVLILNRAELLTEEEQITELAADMGITVEEAKRQFEAVEQKFEVQRLEAISDLEAEVGRDAPRG